MIIKRYISKLPKIEVEKRFLFDNNKLDIFKSNKGIIPFKSIKFIKEVINEDSYYDNKKQKYPLTTKNIWLRKRNNDWECKLAINTDIKNSIKSHYEIENIKDIIKIIDKNVLHSKNLLEYKNFENFIKEKYGLTTFCSYKTTRHKYIIDDIFIVDLDFTEFKNFKYNIGEIELIINKNNDIQNTEKKIIEFSKKYNWFFNFENPVMGKLSKYIFEYNKQQWDYLIKAGIN